MTLTLSDVDRELREEAAAAGIPIPTDKQIPDDGRFLRYPRVGKRPSDDACFARLGIGYSGRPYGVAGCKATDILVRAPWRRDRLRDIDPTERRRLAKAAGEAQRRADEAEAERHRIGLARWTPPWDAAAPCEDVPLHPYPLSKGETLPRCRIASDGRLMIPRYAVDGEMVGGQWISATPDASGTFAKRYSAGTPTVGTFYLLGSLEPRGTVLVCEGAITGATLHRETGHAVTCAMDCGNLRAVCEALRDRFPDIAITLAGDDDRATAGNPGRTKAAEAARAVGGRVAFPTLCEGCTRCTDFNDVAQCEATRRAGAA